MALIKTIDVQKYMITINDAYHKIDTVNINVNSNNISFTMLVYTSKEARLANLQPIDIKFLNIPFKLVDEAEAETFIGKMYLVIKKILFEYKDSIDDLTPNEIFNLNNVITGEN